MGFAKLFRSNPVQIQQNQRWWVYVGEKRVVLPINPGRVWLDWDIAISFLAHDAEVKLAYSYMIGSRLAPELFIDVGANYGTHTLFFLVQGIPAISLEPNVSCHPYFREVCAMNGVVPDIRAVAAGSKDGSASLVFPEGETWNGTVRTDSSEFSSAFGIQKSIQIVRLDSLTGEVGGRRLLLKIDAEGSEVEVLRGAIELMRKNRPTIVFECFQPENRSKLFELFTAEGYCLRQLPSLNQPRRFAEMKRESFERSAQSDFIAIPSEANEAFQGSL